ncbi:MAG TPA: archaemetzincin [Thermoanaerobaculia bacterium]|nr:archaemetzincin [Thermoanaerobaculia bacterium]
MWDGPPAVHGSALACLLDPAAFEPMPRPGPNDWLANHPEKGQTVDEFVHSRPNKSDPQHRTIYLQPLGTFELGPLKEFTEAFFMMPVMVRPPIDLKRARITSRNNPYSGQQQLLTTDILAFLHRQLPADAFCMLGITTIDLYPDPSWNFVFGQAALRDRVGVYSFARYGGDGPKIFSQRSCKVIAHETSHMFGIEHCVFYRCALNGSNHLAESDARPMHLCPVDLRKLQWSVDFDAIERYRRLRAVCERAGFTEEANWYAAEIRRCGK